MNTGVNSRLFNHGMPSNWSASCWAVRADRMFFYVVFGSAVVYILTQAVHKAWTGPNYKHLDRQHSLVAWGQETQESRHRDKGPGTSHPGRTELQNHPLLDIQEVPAANVTAQYWAIAFTGSDVCDELAGYFPGWTILMVGSVRKARLTHSGCRYLAPEEPGPRHKHVTLSVKHRSLLYAIKNGAQGVYVVPITPDNNSSVLPRNIQLTKADIRLLVESDGLFNPAQHWGCKKSRPTTTTSYKLCQRVQPSIKLYINQFLVPVESDNIATETSHIECDESSPPIVLSHGTFGYLLMDGALVLADAFWALGFVDFPNADDRNMVSFILQKLLPMTGQYLEVLPASIHKFSVQPTRKVTDKNLTALVGLECSMRKLTSCVIEILTKSAKLQLISARSADKVTAWVRALQGTGYSAKLPHARDKIIPCKFKDINYHPVYYDTIAHKSHKDPQTMPINNMHMITDLHDKTCNESNISSMLTSPDFQWHQTLLIVVFNSPIYTGIPVLETLYRPYFPKVLYCGPQPLNATHKEMLKPYNISHVSYALVPNRKVFAGTFSYRCLNLAVQMGYKVDGYFIVADDLVINPKIIKNLDRNKTWYRGRNRTNTFDVQSSKRCSNGVCEVPAKWAWLPRFRKQTIKALEELGSRANSSALARRCLDKLALTNGGPYRVNGGIADIFYVPVKWAVDFTTLSEIFLNNGVFLEIAVPTIVTCLFSDVDISTLAGTMLWGARQRSIPHVTDIVRREMANIHYIHPVKWGNFFANKTRKTYEIFYCYLLPELYMS